MTPPLRVRTLRATGPLRFTIDHGQRNAELLPRRLTYARPAFWWTQAMAPVPEPSYDIVHSWNAVPVLTRRPFLVTFESFLPRLPDNRVAGRLDRPLAWLEARLRDRLLDDRCLALLPLSEYARRQFRRQHRGFARLDALEAKMEVLYPSVAPRRVAPKGPSDRLRLLFVGYEFMRKGGPALQRAHERRRQSGIPVETTVVSTLQWSADDYIGPPSRTYVEAETRRLSLEGVTHHRRVPNAEVMRLMEEADYFVLPMLHDTFGYVTLEALSCGTPAIATDTCAQPELIEHGRSGFLLPFDNDPDVGKWPAMYRRTDPGYLEEYDATIARLADALAETLARAWEDRASYEALSAGALERVRSRFSKDYARAHLEALYERGRG